MLRIVKVSAASYAVNSGIVGLTAEQAKARLHNLKLLRVVDKRSGAAEYEVVNPIMFKLGEEFGFSGTISRSGVLSDPQAEREAELARAKSLAAASEAGYRAGAEAARAEYAQKLQELGDAVLAAKAEARVEFFGMLLAKLAPEVATVVGPIGDELLKV